MEEEFLVEVLKDIVMNKQTLEKIEYLVEFLLIFDQHELAKLLYKEAFSFAKLTNKKIENLGQ